MRIGLTTVAGLIGLWLGYYYGAQLGYAIWNDQVWAGPVFACLGMAAGLVVAVKLTLSLFRIKGRR